LKSSWNLRTSKHISKESGDGSMDKSNLLMIPILFLLFWMVVIGIEAKQEIEEYCNPTCPQLGDFVFEPTRSYNSVQESINEKEEEAFNLMLYVFPLIGLMLAGKYIENRKRKVVGV